MIYKTLLASDESPPNLTQIKRALLTYDKVLIPSPEDRDLIPPQTFFEAVSGMPPLFGFLVGPVRPLGKVVDFDRDFDKAIEICKPAIENGSIEVISSYQSSNEFTLGGRFIGDYPLNPSAMFWLYRNMANNNEFLLNAVKNDTSLFIQGKKYLEEIVINKCAGDGMINGDSLQPSIIGTLQNEDLRGLLTLVARGRLSSTLKTIGYCAAKEIIPFFSNEYQHNITNTIIQNATSVIDRVSEHDPYWSLRSQTLEIAHNEYLNEALLESLSIKDVIGLRTKIWGEQAEARDSLMESISEITKEIDNKKDFKKIALEKILAYKKTVEAIEQERRNLNFKIKCDFGILATTAIGSVALSQPTLGFSVPTALTAGIIYSLEKIKEYGPLNEQLKCTENEFKKTAGFGLHNFYRHGLKQGNIKKLTSSLE